MIQRHNVTNQHPVKVVSNEQPSHYTVGERAKISRVCDYCNDYIFTNNKDIDRVILHIDIDNYLKMYHPNEDVKESLEYLKNNIATELDKILTKRKKVYNVYTN